MEKRQSEVKYQVSRNQIAFETSHCRASSDEAFFDARPFPSCENYGIVFMSHETLGRTIPHIMSAGPGFGKRWFVNTTANVEKCAIRHQ